MNRLKAAPSLKEGAGKLNVNERTRLEKLYKSAVFYTVDNVPFSGGDSNPLMKKLNLLSRLNAKSQSGEDLLKLYNNYKKLGLDNEHPVTRRAFLGQLLLKLKINKSALGFVVFMKQIASDVKTLQPLLDTNMRELIILLQSLPPGELRNKRLAQLKKWLGYKDSAEETDGPARPVDPIVGDLIYSHLGKEGTSGSGYGPLEDIDPFGVSAGGLELNRFNINNLDPFQIILLKEMVKGYNQFAKTIREDADLKKLLSFNRPEIIMLKRKLGAAILSMEQWIIQTVTEMKSSKGKQLLPIYKKRIAALKFPSLPVKITIISPGLYKVAVRSKIENEVKKGLRAAIPAMQLISKYIGTFSDILSRKKMFKTAPNRSNLNRFWAISYTLFKSKKGPEKTKFEFLCMLLDSIKDDKEFVKVSSRMKPIIVDLLRNSKDANKLSKRYLGKDFHQLTRANIDSLLLMILPSYVLSEKDTKTQEYKTIKSKLIGLLKDGNIQSIKQKSQLTYTAITTVVQNLLSIAGSLVSEKDPVKAKRKLNDFINSFKSIKKLLGPDAMVLIRKKNPQMGLLLDDPRLAVSLLKLSEGRTLGTLINRYEKVNGIKKPEVVKQAISYAQKVRKELRKRRKIYLSKMAKLKIFKASKKFTLNYRYVSWLAKNMKALKNVNSIISDLQLTWDLKTFKAKEAKLKAIMYGTRYLQVPRSLQQQMNFEFVAQARTLKKNYNNLFYISSVIFDYLAPQLNKVCRQKGCKFAYARLSQVIYQVILTYGYEQQSKLGKNSAYSFLKTNSGKFSAEIANRVNTALKQSKFTAVNDPTPRNVYFTGDVSGFIQNFIDKKVIPRTRRAKSHTVA